MKRRLFVVLTLIWITSSSYSQLKIYCLDVNQGDATLVISPDRKTLLIDTGLKKEANEILEIMAREHITSIDHAVLTHYDSDHLGGFALLKEKGVVINNAVFDNGGNAPQSYATAVKARNIIGPGFHFSLGNDVTVTCLAAKLRTVKSSAEPNAAPNFRENQNSVALLIQYEGFDFFIAGDLTVNVEQQLLMDGDIPDVDVYHVSHHGSVTSSDEDFIRELSPEVSIVSNGVKFNHPTKQVIDVLQGNGSEVYQTNKNTNTKKWTEPIKNVANAFIGDLTPSQDRGTILIEVENGEYTVSLERKNFKNGKPYVY